MPHRRICSLGKSNFLKFMLAWLLSAQQVVLLCDNTRAYLFYCREVYFRATSDGFWDLPVHREEPYRSVWGLIDVDFGEHGPPISSNPIIWPIQASPPKSVRWRSWHKQFTDSALWGMPLWSLDELVEGYAFSSFYSPSQGSSLTLLHLCSLSISPQYNALQSTLGPHLSHLDGLTAPKAGVSKVDAILEVLHLEKQRERVEADGAVEEEEEAEYPGELGDDTAMDQDQDMVNQVNQAQQPQVPVYTMKQVLRILVHIATEEFGFIPRDVYGGIANLPEMRKEHAKALAKFDYSGLKALINAFTYDKELDVSSHRVIVVFPTENCDLSDEWEIDFKSIRVAERAVEAMRQKEDQNLWEIYDSIYRLPEGSTLAGRIFDSRRSHIPSSVREPRRRITPRPRPLRELSLLPSSPPLVFLPRTYPHSPTVGLTFQLTSRESSTM